MANADETLFLWINGIAGRLDDSLPVINRAAEWFVSDYLVPVSLALALIALWFVGKDRATRKMHQIGVFVALSSMAFASLAVFTINAAYFRPRPFVDHDVTLLFYQPTDSSFPANAVAATFGIAAAVWSVNRRWGTVLLVGASLHGIARVYAGVHYPMDIVAGALIGIVVTSLVFRLKDLLGLLPTWVIKAARILCLA